MSSIPTEIDTKFENPSISHRGDDGSREISVLKQLGFTQVERLGKDGSYGRVYKAVHPDKGPLIAKCPQNPNDPRWPKEVANHKNLNTVKGVPQYLGAFEFDGCSFLFVKYVEGNTLADQYGDKDENGNKRRKIAAPQMDAARVVCEAAKIAHEFHAKGYLHRDLSISNVMVDNSGAIRVIDFGLSLWADTPHVTKSDEPGLGTAWFRSPEQSKKRSEGWELDARTDVYSLGRLLLWLLAEKIEGKTPVLPKEIDGKLKDICNKATAEQRDDRFPDAKTLADALAAWLPKDPDAGATDVVYHDVDRYLEPWRDRLNRCFRSEDEFNGEAKILHVYHEIDKRPTVKYDLKEAEDETVADSHRPSTDEDKAWYLKYCETVEINDIHAVITGLPDWKSGVVQSRVAFYKEIKFWRHQMEGQRGMLPRVLSANPMLFCEKESVVLVHKRSSESATYAGKVEKRLHTFGGGFMPAFGKRSARDDAHDLLLTATRECMEESGLAPSFARDTPAIMCRELLTNFHQLMVFAKSIGKWEYRHVCTVDPNMGDLHKWEGDVFPISFDRLERVLIDPEKEEDAHWVPTGRLHILAWLAMGAPLLRPEKKFFGGKTPWEVYQSVTSAILLKQQESDTTK